MHRQTPAKAQELGRAFGIDRMDPLDRREGFDGECTRRSRAAREIWADLFINRAQ